MNTACPPTPTAPCVTVAKTTDRSVASVGDVITYTYAVCNCGLGSLTINSVVDSQLGNLTADFITANGGASLAAGDCTSFTKTRTVLATDPSPLVNSVTVSASSGGVTVADTALASVIITTPGPCVTMEKTANRTVASVGDFVTYTFRVCNCGTAPLTVNNVLDSRLGNLTADFIAANGGSAILGTDLCTSFNEVYQVQATDSSPLTNVAAVSASSGGQTVTSPQSQASVVLIVPGPCVTVVKTASPSVAGPGDVVTYTYTVCNCGTTPLTVSSVVDSRLGDLFADFMAANGGTALLEVGACATFSKAYTVVAADPSPLVNSVTVNAANEGVDVTDTAQAAVTIKLGRRCFLPITLTQQGWHNFCASAPGVPGGLIFNVFPRAFAQYSFFGTLYTNQVKIGAPANVFTPGGHLLTFTGSTPGLTQLCNFLPQIGPADRLWGVFVNPSYLLSRTGAKVSNILAGELLALTLNIAYNDMRLLPRSKGYDLELFVLNQGLFKGKTVGQVWNIADAVLSGIPPCTYGLTSMNSLVSILQSINANYEFVDINTFIDNGYLTPNVPYGPAGPAHSTIVPF